MNDLTAEQPPMKVCKQCRETKPTTAYYKYVDGYLHGRCKECHNKIVCERIKERSATDKDFRQRRNEASVRYQKRTGNARKKKRYHNDENYRSRIIGYLRTRHSRQRNLISQLTTEEWRWLMEQSANRCVYCGGIESDTNKLVQEHTIPVVQGGAYTITNIRPACKSCNSRKGGRTPEQAGMKMVIEINPLKHMKQGELF